MTPPGRAVAAVNGVRLHYETMGSGEPLVFVHGGGDDLSYWRDELPAFAARFRVLAYSRRHAAPNDNPAERSYNSLVDAADLAALLETEVRAPAHIVAASIGGCAALFVAARSPALVRSLVLAEPPMLRWAQRTAEGATLFEDFMRNWERARASFACGGRADGMRALLDYLVAPGTYDRLPPAVRERLVLGASDWDALTASDDPFPPLDEREVRAITAPVLLLRAERTIRIHTVVDDQLTGMWPAPAPPIAWIAGASHDMWADEPAQCRTATMRFLSSLVTTTATSDPIS